MAEGWWSNSGAISGCVAAYCPVGSSSLAASYVNLQNPGTYDATAPVAAPTFNAATGWTFNGTTQYLTLGGLSGALKPVTYIIRMTPADASGALQAPLATSASGGLMFDFRNFGTIDVRFLRQNVIVIGSSTDHLTQATNVVVAITYSGAGAYAIYKNAATPTTGTNNQTPTASDLWVSGQASRFFHGDVAALAVYNTVLTAGQVATLTTLMNALPVAASGGPVLLAQNAHWYGVNA